MIRFKPKIVGTLLCSSELVNVIIEEKQYFEWLMQKAIDELCLNNKEYEHE